MLVGPPFTGLAHAGLDLVEDEQEFQLVSQLAQGLEEILGEMTVAAFALDGFDDQAGHLVGMGGAESADLLGHGVDFGVVVGVVVIGEDRSRIDHVEIEAGEIHGLGLMRGVGAGQGVAVAAVESSFEVDDLVGFLGDALLQVLSGLPVEGGLHGVLIGQAAGIDVEDVAAQFLGQDAGQGFDEVGERHGVEVAVGGLETAVLLDLFLEILAGGLGVVRQGHRGVEIAEVQVFLAVPQVYHVGAVGLVKVRHLLVGVRQDVLFQKRAYFFGFHCVSSL